MVSLIALFAVVASAWAAGPSDNNCGYTSVTPNTERIVGGVVALPYSWPWQTQIRYYGQHWCGGSIISENYVLSAAHCFEGYSQSAMSFRFGRHSRIGSGEPYEQISSPRAIYNHEQYNAKTTINDIALVRLSTPVKYTNQVKAVCLPTRSTTLPTGTSTYVTGWGDLSSGGSGPDYLMQVMLPIFDRTTCNSYSYYNGGIKTGMFCAGYAAGGKDSCQGDSGGPLVAKIDGRWEQYGVVSWGDGCAGPRRPGVYSDVVYFESWIRNKVLQVEFEEEQVRNKFKPRPIGAVFDEQLDVEEDDVPMVVA